MAIIKKSTNNKCWRICGEKETLLPCWWECKLVQPLWKIVWKFLKKTKNRTTITSSMEKAMATHSSVLDCRIPGTGEPGGLQSMGSHRVGHDWRDLAAAAGILESFLLGPYSPYIYILCHFWGAYDESSLIFSFFFLGFSVYSMMPAFWFYRNLYMLCQFLFVFSFSLLAFFITDLSVFSQVPLR